MLKLCREEIQVDFVMISDDFLFKKHLIKISKKIQMMTLFLNDSLKWNLLIYQYHQK